MRSAADAPQLWAGTPRERSRPGLLTVVLVFVAVIWTLGVMSVSVGLGKLGWDVRFAYLPAAEAVLHGRSPYPALDDPILLDQKGYVYPPQLLFLVLPLTVLPVALAGIGVAVGLGATLALSPIVWLHYLVVLLVPMAIARPRFTPLWLLPILLWTSP